MVRALFVLLLVAGPSACAGARASRDLARTVDAYHELLRWKKYEVAVRFRPAVDQQTFLARYLAAEDDLHVDTIEIRSVTFLPAPENEPQVAVVTAVAQAYLLPSTVLEKIIMEEHWEQQNSDWVLVKSDRELVPPLDEDPQDAEQGGDTTQPPHAPHKDEG